MKIVCITGTDVKGCTHNMKETFLAELRNGNEVIEFTLPKDAPPYCIGCKNCFLLGADKCPHANKVMPIWEAMIEADLIVFAYPTYVLRAPAQVKSLLDHIGCYWFVHRVDKRMFNKRAIIISQGIGPVYKKAVKDVKTSLNWLGISNVKYIGFGLMETIIWNDLSNKRRNKIVKKIKEASKKYEKFKNGRMSIKVKMLFFISKIMHKTVYKNELKKGFVSLDNQHWIDNGWLNVKNYEKK